MFDNLSSVGVVIRDCKGCVVAILYKPLQACFPAELTEITALEHGVLLAQELQLSRVIIESNSLNAIQAINDRATGNSSKEFFRRVIHLRPASSSI